MKQKENIVAYREHKIETVHKVLFNDSLKTWKF